jgi:hypothetical protein
MEYRLHIRVCDIETETKGKRRSVAPLLKVWEIAKKTFIRSIDLYR